MVEEPTGIGSLSLQRQLYLNNQPARLRRQCGGRATMAVGNFSHDGQTQAAPAGQLAGAPEALKDLGQICR